MQAFLINEIRWEIIGIPTSLGSKMAERSKKRRRSNEGEGSGAGNDGEATVYLRLGAALQKHLAGRSHCTPADLTKNTLIARLLEMGELTLVDAVFDVSVQMLAGDTFDVTMDNKDSKVLALKHKIQDKQGTSVDCQELLLVDGAAEDEGKGEGAGEGVDVSDRVVLQDAADVVGACSVVLYVKESGEGDSFCLIQILFMCVCLLSDAKSNSKSQGEEACSGAEEASSGDQEASYR